MHWWSSNARVTLLPDTQEVSSQTQRSSRSSPDQQVRQLLTNVFNVIFGCISHKPLSSDLCCVGVRARRMGALIWLAAILLSHCGFVVWLEYLTEVRDWLGSDLVKWFSLCWVMQFYEWISNHITSSQYWRSCFYKIIWC